MIDIKAILLNANNDKIEISLPSDYDRLKEEVLKTENNLYLTPEDLNTEEFGEIVYSVVDTDYKTLKVKEPTNIFYLNAYLQILEYRGKSLPRKTSTFNTKILKTVISEILQVKKSSISLNTIYDFIYPVKKVKEKIEKPMFTIEGIRARQKIIDEEYRRKKYGSKN